MDASGTIAKDQEIEFNALEGSLSMMSKGLGHYLIFHSRFADRFDSFKRCSGFVRNLTGFTDVMFSSSSPFLAQQPNGQRKV